MSKLLFLAAVGFLFSITACKKCYDCNWKMTDRMGMEMTMSEEVCDKDGKTAAEAAGKTCTKK